MFELAFSGGSQELQVSASIAWLNRVEGKLVAMTVRGSPADLSTLDDTDLEHELRLHAARIQTTKKKD